MTARTDVRALALVVVDHALTARLWTDLDRPDEARVEVDRTLDALAAFDAALTPQALGRHPAHESP